jgi:hypothetical protein
MSVKRFHPCISTAALLQGLGVAELCALLAERDGRPYTETEARDYLAMQATQGRSVVPRVAGCGYPCTRSGCSGFNYDTGCPGHVPEAAATAEVTQ